MLHAICTQGAAARMRAQHQALFHAGNRTLLAQGARCYVALNTIVHAIWMQGAAARMRAQHQALFHAGNRTLLAQQGGVAGGALGLGGPSPTNRSRAVSGSGAPKAITAQSVADTARVAIVIKGHELDLGASVDAGSGGQVGIRQGPERYAACCCCWLAAGGQELHVVCWRCRMVHGMADTARVERILGATCCTFPSPAAHPSTLTHPDAVVHHSSAGC